MKGAVNDAKYSKVRTEMDQMDLHFSKVEVTDGFNKNRYGEGMRKTFYQRGKEIEAAQMSHERGFVMKGRNKWGDRWKGLWAMRGSERNDWCVLTRLV
jgi:hypothetical protein